jgi:hypothetical protein
MLFERIDALARATPTHILCHAWELDSESVRLRKAGECPMTIREVGALAHANGLVLADVIPV